MLRPDYPIVTERLHLRPFEPGDLDALVAIHSVPEMVRYLHYDVRDRDELRGVLAEKQQRDAIAQEGDALNLAAVLAESGELVGDVTLWWRSEEHRQGEVGYVLDPAHHGRGYDPAHHGRGYATEATGAMLRIGFEDLCLHRVYGRLDARNAASARVLERLGMRREAHILENERIKGEWADELLYALLAREWRDALTRAAAASAP